MRRDSHPRDTKEVGILTMIKVMYLIINFDQINNSNTIKANKIIIKPMNVHHMDIIIITINVIIIKGIIEETTKDMEILPKEITKDIKTIEAAHMIIIINI